jgi:DNA helicase HerA-like ATPase
MYGNVSAASVGAIQRALLAFEEEGGEQFFGEPELDIRDWMRTGKEGRGYINILSSKRLIQSPTVYATFLLWMMTDLYEKLPEVGDLDKPRMIFFFDEAHLLFSDCPKALVQKITQIVKLIRSKGVGIYFVTQSPSDIPNEVLAQLSNRVQHALRAYTPAEQKAIRAAAKAFRVNPAFDTETALTELGVGEALVSFLDEKGIPTVVERAKILPPQSMMGIAEESAVQSVILTPGSCLVLFPGDAHRPGMAVTEPKNISRIVFKVLTKEN